MVFASAMAFSSQSTMTLAHTLTGITTAIPAPIAAAVTERIIAWAMEVLMFSSMTLRHVRKCTARPARGVLGADGTRVDRNTIRGAVVPLPIRVNFGCATPVTA